MSCCIDDESIDSDGPIDPQDQQAFDHAQLLESQDDIAAARQQFEQLAALGASLDTPLSAINMMARMSLAQLLLNRAASQSDFDRAESLYRSVLASRQDPTPTTVLAFEKLAILLVQERRSEAASELLESWGYRYRLSDAVLRYAYNGQETPCDPARPPFPSPASLVRAVDHALPPALLHPAMAHFAPDAAFWRDHRYSAAIIRPSPYFSRAHPLSEGSTFMDVLIRHIQRVACSLFPAVANARWAEWWAHCRPHHSGHQMHFDSDDEGRNGVRNPIVSTVVYLSEGVGGPTLVTNQRIGSKALATCGWFVPPKVNRLTVFDGTYLHGVVPGRGIAGKEEIDEIDEEEEKEGDGKDTKKRITLMIAFWENIQVRTYPEGTFGASMPAQTHLPEFSFENPPDLDDLEEVAPILVSPIWTPIGNAPVVPLTRMPSYDECFQGF